jgi:hypothetical protein
MTSEVNIGEYFNVVDKSKNERNSVKNYNRCVAQQINETDIERVRLKLIK